MGCGAWAITLLTIVVVFVFSAAFILSSIGIAPVVNSDGLSWDSSAYVAHDANRTTRYVAEQENKTERNKQDNETLRIVAVVVAVMGTIALIAYQRERTKRHNAALLAQENETRMRLQMYIAYLGMNGAVGRYRGDLGVFDRDRGEFVPAGVALLELKGNGY